MKRWRIAGINFDHFHMGDLLRQTSEHPNAEIVAICDEHPERMVEAAHNFNLRPDQVFTDHRACLEQTKPDIVVLELGANDALRGLPLPSTEDNLTQMARASQAAGAKVLLVGIQVPPNYGTDYTRRFGEVFPKVAAATKSALVPFLLKNVADAPDAANLFQADRIHPLAVAQPRMLDNVWPELRKLIQSAR